MNGKASEIAFIAASDALLCVGISRDVKTLTEGAAYRQDGTNNTTIVECGQMSTGNAKEDSVTLGDLIVSHALTLGIGAMACAAHSIAAQVIAIVVTIGVGNAVWIVCRRNGVA